MKSIILLALLVGLSFPSFSQKDTADIIPLRNFNYASAPDSLPFTNKDLKKKPLLFVVFSPDCGHCQRVTKELEKNIDHFKGVQILMVTWLSYKEMSDFYKEYEIAKYPNIKMAWSRDGSVLSEYKVSYYPKMIAYDKHFKYLTSVNGDGSLEQLWNAFQLKKEKKQKTSKNTVAKSDPKK